MHRRPPPLLRTPHPRQRGVALFVVIVFVMLSMLLALWGARTALFNEMVVGNDADYQRAFEAAQALLQDAELDIRGESADGNPCEPDASNENICRQKAGMAQIPLEAQEVGLLLADLDGKTTKCSDGLCIKRSGSQDFWNNKDEAKGITLAQMTGANEDGTPAGARYGQYTGARLGSTDAPANPILAATEGDRGGWYWVEVLPYDESSKSSGLITSEDGAISNANLLPMNLLPSVVYRITALAHGHKPSTLVVLQQTYGQQRRKD